MTGKLRTTTLLLTVFIVLSACAQTKNNIAGNKHKKVSYALFITDLTQTTYPGRPVAGETPTTSHKYIIVWKNDTKPETFFWKNGNTWLPCNVSKISNYKPSAIDDKNPFAELYSSKEISLFDIKKNDTLELTTYTGGKFPIPQDIPTNDSNTIYFKAENTTWQTLPVNNMTELPDIIMQ